jgi:hypothetical protein
MTLQETVIATGDIAIYKPTLQRLYIDITKAAFIRKYHILSRYTIECERSKAFPAPIFTELTVTQQSSVDLPYKFFY